MWSPPSCQMLDVRYPSSESLNDLVGVRGHNLIHISVHVYVMPCKKDMDMEIQHGHEYGHGLGHKH
jgi:hypothetical protein